MLSRLAVSAGMAAYTARFCGDNIGFGKLNRRGAQVSATTAALAPSNGRIPNLVKTIQPKVGQFSHY